MTSPHDLIIPIPSKLTPTGLVIEGEYGYEAYEKAWAVITKIEGAIQWIVGDFLLKAEMDLGEKFAQLIDETDYAKHTRANLMWVASRFPHSRRRESLPWSFHAEVAAKPDAEQEEWLNKVESEGWNRAELRIALRGKKPEPVIACPKCGFAGEKEEFKKREANE